MQVRAMGKKILFCILISLSIFTAGCTKTDNSDTAATEKTEKRDKKSRILKRKVKRKRRIISM